MSAERSWDELIGLNERQEYGEAWLPDKHAEQPTTLVGTVAGYNMGPESQWSGERPWICTVQDRDGKVWSVWLNRDVLVREFEEQRPMPDERVVLRYRGQADRASRAGASPAHLYALTVDRAQQLPGFLTRPELERPAERRRDVEHTGQSDLPDDTDGFSYGQPPAEPVADAEVVDEKDEDVPF